MIWKRIVVGIGCLLLLLSTGLSFYYYQKQTALGVVSPLADDYLQSAQQLQFITAQTTTQNYPPNEYFPQTLSPQFNSDLDVDSQAYAVMERQSKQLLLAKNLTQELPVASVTKIMTAIVVLEKADLDMEIRISSAAASIGEAEMGLTAGEILTVEELLYGLILPSGNDAAEALAEGIGGGRIDFIIEMNNQAQKLSLYDTFFFNPTGLDGNSLETTSFSTALDLLALTNFALQNPQFSQIVSTYEKEIPYKTGKHQAYYLYNILQLDKAYPGIKGIKPGNTDFAQETLVSYAENGGQQVIVVLLGAKHSRDEVIKIYDYIFEKLGVKIIR